MTEPIETPPEESEPRSEDDELRKLRAENKSLRTRLRTSEEQAEQAITQLAASQRADVLRAASQHLIDPDDVFRAQPDIGELCDEYGAVDTEKVAAAASELLEAKPHLGRPQPTPPPTERPLEGLRSGVQTEPARPTPSWQSFIRGHTPPY